MCQLISFILAGLLLMPSVEDFERNQNGVIWPALVEHGKVVADSNGQVIVTPAVELDPDDGTGVRWVIRKTEGLDPLGAVVTFDATVIVDPDFDEDDVPIGSIMWPGCFDALVGTASPGNLWEVKGYYATPDLKGRIVRRRLGLMRYKDSLPTIQPIGPPTPPPPGPVLTSLAEAANATDAVTCTVVSGSSVMTEVAAAVDAPDASTAMTLSISEVGNAADSQDWNPLLLVVSENGNAVDAVDCSLSIPASVADVRAMFEVPDATNSVQSVMSESGAAADASNASAGFSETVVEAGAASDSQSWASLPSTMVENANAVDSFTVKISAQAQVSEAGAASSFQDWQGPPPAPQILGFYNFNYSPTGTFTDGIGKVIRIDGKNFNNVGNVTFTIGGLPGSIATITGPTLTTGNADSLFAFAPMSSTAGPADVVVTTPGGTATLSNGFTYLDRPTVKADELTDANFTYLGSITTSQAGPSTQNGNDTFRFSGPGIGYDVNDNTLILSGSTINAGPILAAKVSIPTPVIVASPINSNSWRSLNQATTMSAFLDLTNGGQGQIKGGPQYGGFLRRGADPGGIIFSMNSNYDATGATTVTFGTCNGDLTNGQVWYTLTGSAMTGIHQGAFNGWIGNIPAAWQSAFGGLTHFCGHENQSIIAASCFGPAFFGFNAVNIASNPPGTPFLFYTGSQAFRGEANEDLNWLSKCNGMGFLDNGTKRALVWPGWRPVNQTWYGEPQYIPNDPRNPPNPNWVDFCNPNGAEGEHTLGGFRVTLRIHHPQDVIDFYHTGQLAWHLVAKTYDISGPSSPNPWFKNGCARIDGAVFSDDGTRMYLLQLQQTASGCPIIHVYGINYN